MICSSCARRLLRPKPLPLPSFRQTLTSFTTPRRHLSLLHPSPRRSLRLHLPTTSPNTIPPSPTKITSRTPSRQFSTTPALHARRHTFSPSHFVRKRRHGFLSRIQTRKGRATLKRRKLKGRQSLSH